MIGIILKITYYNNNENYYLFCGENNLNELDYFKINKSYRNN